MGLSYAPLYVPFLAPSHIVRLHKSCMYLANGAIGYSLSTTKGVNYIGDYIRDFFGYYRVSKEDTRS